MATNNTNPKIQILLENLNKSTSNFLAIECMSGILEDNGFQLLRQEEEWKLTPSGKYYFKKNDSALFAFIAGSDTAKGGFHIISAHSDSPCFKIKPNAEIYGDGGVVSLNVEKYGGGILYTWFDRPLSISGRVMMKGRDALHPETRLVDLRRPVATIPHLAIHFNREVNSGNPLSVQKDMKPVLGYFTDAEIAEYKSKGGIIKSLLADHLGVDVCDIIEYELNLYPVMEPELIGVNAEYIQSARLDDLEMAFAGLEALISVDSESESTRILAIFDNEETGSGTKQGAASPVLRDAMERMVRLTDGDDSQNLYRAIANSFMISADNAHAWHPNYNEKYDPTNHPVIGGGPVIKINANCKYMTDAVGAAVFSELCKEAGVHCQYFVNHADVAGGSTLGNISSSQFDIRGVDMGAAIWAMHSTCETAGATDYIDCVKVFGKFFEK